MNRHIPETLEMAMLESAHIEDAMTIPAGWYVEPDMHRWDLDVVFKDSWQLFGASSRLAEPTSYAVDAFAGGSVVATRGTDDQVRAFHNVCRHRAGPVARGSGRCDYLRCGYHGWVYGLDGRLVRAPDIGDLNDFDPADYGLVRLETALIDPLLFVARTRPAGEISTIFNEIADRIQPTGLGGLVFRQRQTFDIDCNWKVYVDNYLEGYHLPQVHPELTQMLDYRNYATETHPGYSLQFSTIDGSSGAYASGDAFYYFLFPNVMLNILPGRLQTNVVLPVRHDRCRVVFDYYYPPDIGADAEAVREDLAFSDVVQSQDIAICEQVQCGLASGAYDRGRFSAAREQGVHHWQEMLKAAYARAVRA